MTNQIPKIWWANFRWEWSRRRPSAHRIRPSRAKLFEIPGLPRPSFCDPESGLTNSVVHINCRQMWTPPPSRRVVSSARATLLLRLLLLAGAADAAPPLVGVSPQGERAAHISAYLRILFRLYSSPSRSPRWGVLRDAGDRLQGRLGLLPEDPAQRRLLRLRRWNRWARSLSPCLLDLSELDKGSRVNCRDLVDFVLPMPWDPVAVN